MAEGEMKVNQWNEEIVGLYRAAKNLDEELATAHDFCEMEEGSERTRKKLHVRHHHQVLNLQCTHFLQKLF